MDRRVRPRDDGKVSHPSPGSAEPTSSQSIVNRKRKGRITKILVLFMSVLLLLSLSVMFFSQRMLNLTAPFEPQDEKWESGSETRKKHISTTPSFHSRQPVEEKKDTLDTTNVNALAQVPASHSTHITLSMSNLMSEAWKTSSQRLTFDMNVDVVNHRSASESEPVEAGDPQSFSRSTSTHSGRATFYGKSSLKLKYTTRRSLHIQLNSPLKLKRPRVRFGDGIDDHREEVELSNFLLLSLWEDTYRLSYRSAIDFLKEHQLFFAYAQLVELRCVPSRGDADGKNAAGASQRDHVCAAPVENSSSSSALGNGITLGVYLLLEYPSDSISRYMTEACAVEMNLPAQRKKSTFPGFHTQRHCEHTSEYQKRLSLWRHVVQDAGKTFCKDLNFETSVRNWFYWKKPAMYDLIHVPSYVKNSSLSSIYRILETDSARYGVHATIENSKRSEDLLSGVPLNSQEEFFDLPQYYKWLALNTLLGNGDYDDEVFFYGVSETTANVRGGVGEGTAPPRRFLSMMAWDYDTIFANCHRPPKVKLPRGSKSAPSHTPAEGNERYSPNNPEELLFCAETPLEAAIVRVDSLRQRYYDTIACILASSKNSVDERDDERARWKLAVTHSQCELNAILVNAGSVNRGSDANGILEATFGEMSEKAEQKKRRISDVRTGRGAVDLVSKFFERYESIKRAFGDDVGSFTPLPTSSETAEGRSVQLVSSEAPQKTNMANASGCDAWWSPALFLSIEDRHRYTAQATRLLNTERNIVSKRPARLERTVYMNMYSVPERNATFLYQRSVNSENTGKRIADKPQLRSSFPPTMQVAGVLHSDFSQQIHSSFSDAKSSDAMISPEESMREAGLFCMRVAVAIESEPKANTAFTGSSTPVVCLSPTITTVDATIVGAAEAAAHRSFNARCSASVVSTLSETPNTLCGAGGICSTNASQTESWSALCTRAREAQTQKRANYALVDVPIVLRSNERGAAEYGLREYVKPPPPVAPRQESHSTMMSSVPESTKELASQQEHKTVNVDFVSPKSWPSSAGWFPAIVRLSHNNNNSGAGGKRDTTSFPEDDEEGEGSSLRGQWLRRNAAIELLSPQSSDPLNPSNLPVVSTTVVRGFCSIRLVRASHQARFTHAEHGPLLHLPPLAEGNDRNGFQLLVHSIEGLPGLSVAHAAPDIPQWVSRNSARSTVVNNHKVASGSVLIFSTAGEEITVTATMKSTTAFKSNTLLCPVLIEGLLIVEDGAELIIEEGCAVVMAASARVDVQGSVAANGTRAAPVVFMDASPADGAFQPWDTIYLHGPKAVGSFVYTFFTGSGVPNKLVAYTGKHHSHSSAITVTHHAHLTLYGSFFIDLSGPALSAGNPDIQNPWVAAPESSTGASGSQTTHVVHKVASDTNSVTVTSEIVAKHTVVQWAEMGVECVNCGLFVALSSAFLLFPSWDTGYADRDNDALYLSGGMHVVSGCVIAHTKDDGIDSGTPQHSVTSHLGSRMQLRIATPSTSNLNVVVRTRLLEDVFSALAQQQKLPIGEGLKTGTSPSHELLTVDADFLLLRASIIEYCQHEGVALSSSPKAARRVHIDGVVVQHCQQCIEVGYASRLHIAVVSNTFVHHCEVGLRYGDNYMDANQHGQLTLSDHVHFVGNEVNVLHYIRHLRAPHSQSHRYLRAELVRIPDAQKACRWGSGVILWPDGRHRVNSGQAIGWCEELYQLPLIASKGQQGMNEQRDVEIECDNSWRSATSDNSEDHHLVGFVTTRVDAPPVEAYDIANLEAQFLGLPSP